MRKYDKTLSMGRFSNFTNYRMIYISFDKDINSIHYLIYIDRYTMTYSTLFLFCVSAGVGRVGEQEIGKYRITVTKTGMIPYSV